MNYDVPKLIRYLLPFQKEYASQEISNHSSDNLLSNNNDTSLVTLLLSIVLAPALAIVLQLFLSSSSNTTPQHVETRNSSSLHYRRRIQHALTGLLFYILSYMISRPIAMTLLCISSISFYTIHKRRSSLNKVQDHFLQFFGPLLREYEKNVNNLPGAFWFLFGCTIVVCCFPINIARTSILCLAFGDPIAAIVGIQVRGPKLQSYFSTNHEQNQAGDKSIAGCLACFVICYLVAMACMNPYGPTVWFLTGCTATVMEVLESVLPYPFVVDDNLLIPVGTGIVLWLYTTIGGTHSLV
jgi:dolichol kinase